LETTLTRKPPRKRPSASLP